MLRAGGRLSLVRCQKVVSHRDGSSDILLCKSRANRGAIRRSPETTGFTGFWRIRARGDVSKVRTFSRAAKRPAGAEPRIRRLNGRSQNWTAGFSVLRRRPGAARSCLAEPAAQEAAGPRDQLEELLFGALAVVPAEDLTGRGVGEDGLPAKEGSFASPGTSRNPRASTSSAASISTSAVDSHSESGPDRLRNPRMATGGGPLLTACDGRPARSSKPARGGRKTAESSRRGRSRNRRNRRGRPAPATWPARSRSPPPGSKSCSRRRSDRGPWRGRSGGPWGAPTPALSTSSV